MLWGMSTPNAKVFALLVYVVIWHMVWYNVVACRTSWQQRGGADMFNIMESFIVSLLSNMVVYVLTKWLEEHENNGK